MRRSIALTAMTVALGFAAACGGSSSGGSDQLSGQKGSGTTISSGTASGAGTVLVDSKGRTLYTPEQEASGDIVCTGTCVDVWVPVTVSGGADPVAGNGVTAQLATVSRSDGSTQVTANGQPLYTFTVDKASGSAEGNGVTDAFDGNHFTWHAVGADGTVSSAAKPTPSSSSTGYSYDY